jgi:hypothetical protein
MAADQPLKPTDAWDNVCNDEQAGSESMSSFSDFQFDEARHNVSAFPMSDPTARNNLPDGASYQPSAPGAPSGLCPIPPYHPNQMGPANPHNPRTSQSQSYGNHLEPPPRGVSGLSSPTHNHWGPIGSLNYFSSPLDTPSFNMPAFNMPAFNQGTGSVGDTGTMPANNMANPLQMTFRNGASA